MKKGVKLTPTEQIVERAYLVGVSLPESPSGVEREHLEELAQLAMTAGAVVAGGTIQGRTRVDGTTFIGPGKAQDVKAECERLGANLVIFDSDLSPAQVRNLEEILDVRVIDRTELILDIFARHAKSQQAKTQVELAQLVYNLPRLRRLWTHLSRQAGGIGTRGPGETQLEVDRRRIRERIAHLKKLLDAFDRRHDTIRESRNGYPVVALVGYTNAGKSTLMNALTGADTLAENQLFATLTRKIEGKNRSPILFVDTVGFIRKLPHHLVESFKATLGDIAAADLLLHVIDASHPSVLEQMAVAEQTLREIKSPDLETINVFNKIDAADAETVEGLRQRCPDALFISAVRSEGIDTLKRRVEEKLFGRSLTVEVRIPTTDGRGIARVRSIIREPVTRFENGYCVVTGHVETKLAERLESIDGARIRYLI